MFCTWLWFYNVIKTMGKRKKRWHISKEKSRRKTRHGYHSDICRWKRENFSNEVEIRREIIWMKILNQENFKKDLMNLTETNRKINMNSDHSVRSNKWLKSHLNANSFNMFLILSTSVSAARLMWIQLSEKTQKLSSLTTLTQVSFWWWL